MNKNCSMTCQVEYRQFESPCGLDGAFLVVYGRSMDNLDRIALI